MHDVTIVMTAWNRRPERLGYFRQAVEGLKGNLQDWERVAEWLVSVETQDAICEEEFAGFCAEHQIRVIYRPGPAYLGANLNLALAQVRTPYMLYVQDDQRLRGPLTIGHGVELIQQGLADIVAYQWALLPGEAIQRTFEHRGETYSLLDPQRMAWYYSDRPHLTSRAVRRRIGAYADSAACGDPEINYLYRVKQLGLAVSGYGAPESDARWLFEDLGRTSVMEEKWRLVWTGPEHDRVRLEQERRYDLTVDWTGEFRANWLGCEELRGLWGRPLRVLEIGVHEGRCGCWLLDNVLTHPDAHYTGVDAWISGAATESAEVGGVDQVEARARRNFAQHDARKWTLVKGHWAGVFLENRWPRESFDLVYVDGEHDARSCLRDIAIGWELLKPAGYLVIDDFARFEGVHLAASAFRGLLLAGEYRLVLENSQLALQKQGGREAAPNAP